MELLAIGAFSIRQHKGLSESTPQVVGSLRGSTTSMDRWEALRTLFSTFIERRIAGTEIKAFKDHWGQVILSVLLKLVRKVAFSLRAEVRIENYLMMKASILWVILTYWCWRDSCASVCRYWCIFPLYVAAVKCVWRKWLLLLCSNSLFLFLSQSF